MIDAYRTNSSSSPPPADFVFHNHGSVFLLMPETDAARAWVEDHTDHRRQYFGGAVVVEHRYIADIVMGATMDGLRVA